MSDYLLACAISDIPEVGAVRVDLDDVPVSVVRSEGEIYAIYDICSHEEVSLSEGEVEDGEIECFLHGSRFNLVSGRPTSLPATKPIPVYPVKIDGDDVYVDVHHPTNLES